MVIRLIFPLDQRRSIKCPHGLCNSTHGELYSEMSFDGEMTLIFRSYFCAPRPSGRPCSKMATCSWPWTSQLGRSWEAKHLTSAKMSAASCRDCWRVTWKDFYVLDLFGVFFVGFCCCWWLFVGCWLVAAFLVVMSVVVGFAAAANVSPFLLASLSLLSTGSCWWIRFVGCHFLRQKHRPGTRR